MIDRKRIDKALEKHAENFLAMSAFIDGQRIYYDYLRPHTALDGKTPAEAAEIDLKLKGNRWEAIIGKAGKI